METMSRLLPDSEVWSRILGLCQRQIYIHPFKVGILNGMNSVRVHISRISRLHACVQLIVRALEGLMGVHPITRAMVI